MSLAIDVLMSILTSGTTTAILVTIINKKLDEKLEDIKSRNKKAEEETKQLRDLLASLKKERNNRVHTKKMEAAEILMESINKLENLHFITKIMRDIDLENAIKDEDYKKISEEMTEITKGVDIYEKISQASSVETHIPYLYINTKTMALYTAYRKIVYETAFYAKLLELPIPNRVEYAPRSDELIEMLTNILPESKDTLKEHGKRGAYYYMERLHDETITSLRKELFGEDATTEDYEAVKLLAERFEHIEKQLSPKTALLNSKKLTPQNPIHL